MAVPRYICGGKIFVHRKSVPQICEVSFNNYVYSSINRLVHILTTVKPQSLGVLCREVRDKRFQG